MELEGDPGHAVGRGQARDLLPERDRLAPTGARGGPSRRPATGRTASRPSFRRARPPGQPDIVTIRSTPSSPASRIVSRISCFVGLAEDGVERPGRAVQGGDPEPPARLKASANLRLAAGIVEELADPEVRRATTGRRWRSRSIGAAAAGRRDRAPRRKTARGPSPCTGRDPSGGGSSGGSGAAGSGYAAGRVQRRPVVRSRCRRGRGRDRRDVGGGAPRARRGWRSRSSRGRGSRRGRIGPEFGRRPAPVRSSPPDDPPRHDRRLRGTLAADTELDFRLPVRSRPACSSCRSGRPGPRRIAAELGALWPEPSKPSTSARTTSAGWSPRLAPGVAACRLRIGLPRPPGRGDAGVRPAGRATWGPDPDRAAP